MDGSLSANSGHHAHGTDNEVGEGLVRALSTGASVFAEAGDLVGRGRGIALAERTVERRALGGIRGHSSSVLGDGRHSEGARDNAGMSSTRPERAGGRGGERRHGEPEGEKLSATGRLARRRLSVSVCLGVVGVGDGFCLYRNKL